MALRVQLAGTVPAQDEEILGCRGCNKKGSSSKGGSGQEALEEVKGVCLCRISNAFGLLPAPALTHSSLFTSPAQSLPQIITITSRTDNLYCYINFFKTSPSNNKPVRCKGVAQRYLGPLRSQTSIKPKRSKDQ